MRETRVALSQRVEANAQHSSRTLSNYPVTSPRHGTKYARWTLASHCRTWIMAKVNHWERRHDNLWQRVHQALHGDGNRVGSSGGYGSAAVPAVAARVPSAPIDNQDDL